MKLIRCLAYFTTLSLLCGLAAGTAFAAVVTADISTKTGTSDAAALEVKGVRAIGEQTGILVLNSTLDDQPFTLKVNGLVDGDYDIYINRSYTGVKAAKDLVQGLELTIPGRIVDPNMIRCLEALKTKVRAEYDHLRPSSDPEAQRICYTLNQANDWIRSGIGKDQSWRSVDVIIVPKGVALRPMSAAARLSDYETARTVTRACWLLQQARDRMYDNIKDTKLRNDAVYAMTPLALSAEYTTRNGKPHVEISLLNNCDLPITGNISMALPAGWKTTAKQLAFTDLKSGRTFNVSFDLIAPSKKAAAPDGVPVAANVTLTQDRFTAGLKLRIVAQKAPEPIQ